MDLQEWTSFSISHSTDFTFELQRYTNKYCSRNHRNLNSLLLLYIAEYNPQCQPHCASRCTKNLWNFLEELTIAQQLRASDPL